MLASHWAQKYFLCPIRDKYSNELWNWFVKNSIPEALSPVVENVHHRQFFRPK